MNITRFVLAFAILLFAAWVVVVNWGCVIVSSRNKWRGINRNHSTVPIVSFILAALAHQIYPHPHKDWIVLIPLLDIANWLLLLLPVIWLRAWRNKRAEKGAD